MPKHDRKMIKTKLGIKKAVDIILHKCGSEITLDEFEKQVVKA